MLKHRLLWTLNPNVTLAVSPDTPLEPEATAPAAAAAAAAAAAQAAPVTAQAAPATAPVPPETAPTAAVPPQEQSAASTAVPAVPAVDSTVVEAKLLVRKQKALRLKLALSLLYSLLHSRCLCLIPRLSL